MVRRREIRLDRGALRRQGLVARPPIREERLRVPGQLVAWRGHSGKRYVFKYGDAEGCQVPGANAVVAAVMREDGTATLVDVAACLDAERFEDWRRDAMDAGVTEIQVHALCDSPVEAEAIVEDLGFELTPSNASGLGF